MATTRKPQGGTTAAAPIDRDKPVRISELEQLDIPDHDGLPVTQTKAIIDKTGAGLTESMAMAKVHIPVGTHVVVLVPAVAIRHQYDKIVEGSGKNEVVLEEFAETVKLNAEGALFIDPDLVQEVIEKHLERVKIARSDAERAKRDARGEPELPLPEQTAPPQSSEDGYFDPDDDPDRARNARV